VLQLLCETEAGTVSILCGCKFRSWLSLPTAIALGGVHCDWWESEWEWRAGFGRESRPSEHAVKRSASILISTELHVQYPIAVVRSYACLIYSNVCQPKFRLFCRRLPLVHPADLGEVIDLELTHGLWALVVHFCFRRDHLVQCLFLRGWIVERKFVIVCCGSNLFSVPLETICSKSLTVWVLH
jgi:hypothetical protein